MPKFILYSAHMETVFPMLQGFGKWRMEGVEPGAGLFVEYFKRINDTSDESSEDFVRLYYKSLTTTSIDEYIYLPGRDVPEVPLADFKAFVQGQINKWSLGWESTDVSE